MLKALNSRKITFLGIINLACFVVILTFGLWPFDFRPANQVQWLQGQNGIRFHGRGIVYTKEPMEWWNDGTKNEPLNYGIMELWNYKMLDPGRHLSIEIYLQPGSEPHDYTGRILSFYDGKGTENFVLTQWKSGLILQKGIQHLPEETYPKIGIRDALPKGEKRLFTITSGPEGTTIYIDGKPVEKRARFSLSLEKRESPGRLLLGNSPSGKRPWHGSFLGLAVFDRLLTKEQVSDHFEAWEKRGASSLAGEEGIVALYPFDDRSGGRVRSLVGGPDLIIPSGLAVVQKNVLVPPWVDFRLTSSYLMDVATNLLGFISFGFFFSAYLRASLDSHVSFLS